MPRLSGFSFAGFELDPVSGALLKNGMRVPIARQPFRVLALLVTRPGQLVTREKLRQEIWGDRVHVDFEHGLNVCIRQVRAALGDSHETDSIVLTFPREGYCLNVPVKRVRLTPVPLTQRWTTAAGLAALTGDASRVFSDLRSRTGASAAEPSASSSAMPPALAAIDHRASGQALATLVPDPPWHTKNADAHAWYWRGRAVYDRTSNTRPPGAIRCFERAVALDPRFGLAQVSLAVSCLDQVTAGVTPAQSAARARQATERAIEIAPARAESLVAVAEVAYRLDRHDADAERAFAKAIELDEAGAFTHLRYAIFLQQRRRFDETLEQLRTAEELDPLSVQSSWEIAYTLYLAGQYQDSIVQTWRTLAIDPTYPWSFRTLGQCLEQIGQESAAIQAYQWAGRVALGHLGRAYALTGRTDAARDILAALTERPSGTGLAVAYIHTGLGERAQAFQWLRRTRADGARLPFGLRVAPEWAPLRGERQFRELLRAGDIDGL
jgi:DNA-binding winged helix-turn-helix (wHTH) protein/tetratricopeptide (TPR) repeat protein